MSDYTHFPGDVGLWECSTQAVWGSHDLCPPLLQFKVREIMLSELYALSPTGTWGKAEKFKHDMAILLIAPNKTIKGRRVFGLVAVWAHPLQACHPSLGEVVHRLRLLISTGNDWMHTFT